MGRASTGSRTGRGIGLALVAEAAGVSTATVSNAINRPEIVAPETRARVEAAMRALDFVPNRAAATLRQGSNRLLGVVVPEVVNPFYAAITESIATAAGKAGFAVALCVSHDDPDVELRHFEMLAEQRATAAIVVPLGATGERLTQLNMVGTHLVLIDRILDEHDGCSVAVDDVLGARLAIRHLGTGAANRAVALVNGPTTIPQCADRRRGVFAEIEDGVPVIEFEAAHMTIDEGIAIGRSLADQNISRVFCTNDQLAVGVIRGLRSAGVSVPNDVRVVGYGDLSLAVDTDVSLTTIAQPKAAMGSLAVEKALEEVLGGRHLHSSTLLEPRLIVRESAPGSR